MSIADLATTCFAVQLLVGAILVIGEGTRRLRLPLSIKYAADSSQAQTRSGKAGGCPSNDTPKQLPDPSLRLCDAASSAAVAGTVSSKEPDHDVDAGRLDARLDD